MKMRKSDVTPQGFLKWRKETFGEMGGEAERLVKKLASKMEYHTGQRYSDAVGYRRKLLRFEILSPWRQRCEKELC